MTFRSKAISSLKLSVGLSIIFFLIYSIGFDKMLTLLQSANYVILPLIVLVKLFSLVFTGLNLKLLFSAIRIKISIWHLFVASNLAWSIGLALPGRVGEFSIIYFLKKYDIGLGESSAVVVLDKISSVSVLGVYSILGLLHYFDISTSIRFGVILLILLVSFMLAITNSKIRGLVKRYVLRSKAKLFRGFNQHLHDILNKKISFLFNLLITVIKWMISFYIIKIIFLSFNYNVPIADIILVTSITLLVSLIPISIGGLGVRESLATYLFYSIGVPADITLSVYLTNTLLNYVVGSVIIVANLDKIKLASKY